MDPDSAQNRQHKWVWAVAAVTTVIVLYPQRIFLKQGVNSSQKSVKENTPEVSIKKQKPKANKTIYLTFDDGPNKGSRKVLDIINKEQVPVSFFVVGEHIYGSAAQLALFDSIVASPFIYVANHSYTHAHNKFNQFYAAPNLVVADFLRCADSLHSGNKFTRLPGRNIWRLGNISSTDIASSQPAADSLMGKGFEIMGWDLEWHFTATGDLIEKHDKMLQNVDSVFSKNYTKTKNHIVLLAHDQSFLDSRDSAELHQFIRALKQKDDVALNMISNYPMDQKRSAVDNK